MKELNKTRRLSIATVIFILILIFGLLTLRQPDLSYSLTSDQMLEELFNSANEMTPEEAMEVISNKDATYQFIDLRNPYEFEKGAIPEAINIPVSDILFPENTELFKEMTSSSITLIFYGNTQQEANGIWMLLKQLGVERIKVLLGGYEYIAGVMNHTYEGPESPVYRVEEPVLDFAAYMKEISNEYEGERTSGPETKTIVPVKRKKKTITEGGC
jgi:rhodanese-related sulfurtransferase